jgi:hypothetical protein
MEERGNERSEGGWMEGWKDDVKLYRIQYQKKVS